MPRVLYFNIFICECGQVFKKFDMFKKHQKKREGCKLSSTKHIIYDSRKSIRERLDTKTGISDIGYE
jgi:hypothetical protein